MKFKCFKINQFFLLAVILIATFSSCEKDETENLDSQIEQPRTGFSVINGYLVFESTSSFIETTDAIANLSNNERSKWENEIGFLSQRRLVSNIIEQELVQDSLNELKYADVDITKIDESDFHSVVYLKALKKGVIKTINEGTEEEYWDYAVFNRGFVDFINEDGLFAIGDTLYHVTQNSLKAMKPADLRNPQTLLNAAEPDENNNIVFIYKESNLKAKSPGLIESSWVSSGGGKKGEKRIKIGIYLDVLYYLPYTRSYNFYHEVYVQCQERNWRRKWKYKFTNINVNGSWVVSLYYYPQRYGNNWSWNGNASYLKASINPQTGSSAPYRSYFVIYPNSVNKNLPWYIADQYDYQPKFDSYNWTASRYGGCCGLYARLVK